MTPDGKPIVGPVPDLEGFFIAGGCCVGGLSISPAIGQIVADWIVRGQPPFDVSDLAPDRFGPEYSAEEQLNAAAHWQYANQYTVH
jgi:4-methylaminobutanoate oxidase (formaldehyde-forming)